MIERKPKPETCCAAHICKQLGPSHLSDVFHIDFIWPVQTNRDERIVLMLGQLTRSDPSWADDVLIAFHSLALFFHTILFDSGLVVLRTFVLSLSLTNWVAGVMIGSDWASIGPIVVHTANE